MHHSSVSWEIIDKLRRIWQILTQALKSLKNVHFNALRLSKVYIIWANKLQKSYLSWHWRVMQNLERNWYFSFQNWHEKFVKFSLEHSKVSKIFTLMGSFGTEYIFLELEKYRGAIFHDTEEWCKIWSGIDLSFQN